MSSSNRPIIFFLSQSSGRRPCESCSFYKTDGRIIIGRRNKQSVIKSALKGLQTGVNKHESEISALKLIVIPAGGERSSMWQRALVIFHSQTVVIIRLFQLQ